MTAPSSTTSGTLTLAGGMPPSAGGTPASAVGMLALTGGTLPSNGGTPALAGAAAAALRAGGGSSTAAALAPPAPPLPAAGAANRGRAIIDRALSPMITANSTRMNSSLLTSTPATLPSCAGMAGTSQRRVRNTTSSDGMENASAARTCTSPRRQ